MWHLFFKTASLEEKILTLFLIAASERWMINYLCGKNITWLYANTKVSNSKSVEVTFFIEFVPLITNADNSQQVKVTKSSDFLIH